MSLAPSSSMPLGADLIDPEGTLPSAPLFPKASTDPLTRAEARYLTVPSGDRLRLACLTPIDACRGTVLISVGRSEMIEKYGEVAGELNARGFAVVIQEWAGQGLSGRYLDDPLRAHMTGGPDRQLDNLDHILRTMDGKAPRPWLTLAHSMGGGLTALALVRGEDRFDAAILSAPMICPVTSPYPLTIVRGISERRVAQGRGDEVAGRQADPADATFERNRLTHDRARFEGTRALYASHPELRLGEPTWAWLLFAFSIRETLQAEGASGVGCSLLVVAAEKDRYVDNHAIRSFCASAPDAGLVEVAGAYHEVLFETEERRAKFWEAFDAFATRLVT